MPTPGSFEPLVSRFWARVRKSSDCWEWTGPLSGGYGLLKWTPATGQRRLARAHRLSYEMHHGPIPTGLLVCHHCDNPRCVRPDHLFLGTNSDNQVDAVRKGRHHLSRRKACARGHAYNASNTHWFYHKREQRWARRCRRCHREQELAKYHRRRKAA